MELRHGSNAGRFGPSRVPRRNRMVGGASRAVRPPCLDSTAHIAFNPVTMFPPITPPSRLSVRACCVRRRHALGPNHTDPAARTQSQTERRPPVTAEVAAAHSMRVFNDLEGKKVSNATCLPWHVEAAAITNERRCPRWQREDWQLSNDLSA
jgi:hypothetical protein